MATHDPAAAGTDCGTGLTCDGNGKCVRADMHSDSAKLASLQ